MTSELSLQPVSIAQEMKQSYMDYAMSVIIGRALPDVRDGLKPVQRRVLYAMHSEGLHYGKKFSKCAGVVGEVLKKFHPHGDSSVYDALVRLAQPWNLRYPLVDGQGNFGSIDGDPAAAYRYTECRMTALSERLLDDIEKETVDFSPNFDESTDEPDVLPASFPNLLVNGADGIAVGMATHIPPHNLNEVISATVAVIDNPSISVDELLSIVPGPDFPTGGIIHGKEQIKLAYTTGRGVLQVRSKASFEKVKAGSREAEAIVITEIPYQVNKSRLIERVAELINNKEIEGISKLRDESDRTGMRIVMELKRDATGEVVLNQLFKLTPLQVSFGIINLAIVDGQPAVCPLRDLLQHFINHRRDVVTRRTQFELQKALSRMHILDGFKIALLNLDEVIALIRASESPNDARVGLVKRFDLSELQANAILELRLQKLTGLERLAIEREHAELAALIEDLKALLASTVKIDGVIRDELLKITEQYADTRRTQIEDALNDMTIEDLIEDDDVVISVSHQGYVKRQPLTSYRAQKRGGRGVTGASQKNEDFVEHLFVTTNLSDLLVFTSLGRAYVRKAYHVPEASKTARGRALINLFELKEDEAVTAILPIKEYSDDKFLVMVTKQGVVKKLKLSDFSNVRRTGIIACSLDDGDKLVGASLSTGKDNVLIATKEGITIRFDEDDVRAMGRTARGVRGITLESGDFVVSMAVTTGSDNEWSVLTVCENGYGKRTALEEYRTQGRGGKGVIDIKVEGRNGPVVGIGVVQDTSEIMLITTTGKVIRIATNGISKIGRNTRGVTLINLEEGEKVVAVSPFAEGEEDAE